MSTVGIIFFFGIKQRLVTRLLSIEAERVNMNMDEDELNEA